VFVLQLVALVVCGPVLGWWILLPLGIAVITFTVAERLMQRSSRPEFPYFFAWATAQAMVSVGAALSGGPESPVLMWLPIPVTTLATRFTARGLAVGVSVTLVFLAAATVGVDPGLAVEKPYTVLFPAVAVLSVALLGYALMQSDVLHRNESVVDPLTQLLNRKALLTRAQELEEQARITGEPVGVLVGDLDHFKVVNDRHGHQAGDAVLRDCAYRLRKELRAYDLAYRLGGEEFLVLLPGAPLDETAELAERLRAAVAGELIGQVPVTMSFGVAATCPGEAFDFEALYARADAALYQAKAAGRDCVRGAADHATLVA
jgi:diguanylate cyclase (GGDEF)-like protein